VVTPKKLPTRPGDRGSAAARARVAVKYLEVAELVATEETGDSINVCVGLCVLAGVAAGDAICLVATGERYAGPDHAAAVELVGRVHGESGKTLRALVLLKPVSSYGDMLLSDEERTAGLRLAKALVAEALRRL
jgi:hypothetical protein